MTAVVGRDDELLTVRDLRVVFPGTRPEDAAVKGISFGMRTGQTFGLVGESGSGKSTACLSVMGLLAAGAAVSGSISFRGTELVGAPEKRIRALRGKEIGLVYQDPMAALNPVKTIGAQLREPLRLHQGMSRKQADERAVELLERVGIDSPREKLKSFPHEFSGGMRQRVVIAMAVSCHPTLLIADEPTTALDVSVQAQVLELLSDLTADLGIGLLIVSHDLSVVAGLADDVAVMRFGEIVEYGPVQQVFEHPEHSYTRDLLSVVRQLEGEPVPVPGSVLS
jgi:ABC-type dipeptide/oligopeptide/nickel transport system ATPase component